MTILYHYTINGLLIESGYAASPVDRLPYAVEAPFNSYLKQHKPICLPDTRVDLLRKINSWVDGQSGQCIFWLSGLAGTGKSTIARTFAGTQSQRGGLVASSFFSRGGGDVDHAGKFVTSLACQLANSIPTLHQHVCDAITGYSDLTDRSLREQWHQLVLCPLSKLESTGYQALPEIPIRHGFYQMPDEEYQSFMLHNISPSTVDHDIAIFVEDNLKLIRQERSLDAGWPGEEALRYLVQAASGLFIWATTACRFIREGKRHAARRLDTILKSCGSAGTVTAPEKLGWV
ncbi:hypothetical protein P152DRAFT_451130 [Eremomyces bilateralis CBS 781.70]|uniref:Nephrocystin 3-like N-terminal domain-containing protein n=1 Tax=Eremomyces bilateralis CBS 781.70 TaxID=1392243 RepID=A0A6G1FXA7_9PEZI|nr:uncharacterized protein P152DRAFT_451130 [Eremomyces bilateralis CBS 781.70]KAF1810378.1 hypothetical protein P152DRAFT_451130 [Eremomyces bilateralis CBS 781.70]